MRARREAGRRTSRRRRSLLAALAARALFLTRVFDWLYRMANLVRSELVAGLASDAVLDRFNDIAYASERSYRPDQSSFRAYLFPWEEEAIRRFFPQPPAHVLVGGAGGGARRLRSPSAAIASPRSSRRRSLPGRSRNTGTLH